MGTDIKYDPQNNTKHIPLIPLSIIGLVVFLLGPAIASATTPDTGPPSVVKVEPPSWWSRHSINPVRLLVRGANLHGAHVRAAKAVVQTSGVSVNSKGSYLFVNVHINPTARPGSYPLQVETREGKAIIPFTIETPLTPQTHFQGITSN
ncbi:MAG TPA: cyclomaltodextrinase N-terminal domain-containing protein, partial [Pyrinomonadaceae bacterium]|nr:cyclomaltodextrinase N-terminal domain-containing protein [Pyrinomonadaceae bacterium]